MRCATLIALTLVVSGCTVKVSNGFLAKQCGVDEPQLKAAFEEAKTLGPDEDQTLGRCTLKKSQDQKHVLIDFGDKRSSAGSQ